MAHNCLTVATFQGVKVQVETDLYSTVNNNYMQCLTQDFRRLWSVDYNPRHSLVNAWGTLYMYWEVIHLRWVSSQSDFGFSHLTHRIDCLDKFYFISILFFFFFLHICLERSLCKTNTTNKLKWFQHSGLLEGKTSSKNTRTGRRLSQSKRITFFQLL